MKPLTLKAVATAKAENANNGQVRFIIAPTKNQTQPSGPGLPDVSITMVFADPNQVRDFEINKSYSFTIKPE